MKEYKGATFFASMTSVLNVNSYDVAEVSGIGLSLDEDMELAMLFSAAPELLSALQNIVNYHFGKTATAPAYLEAKAAIAKALGES